MKIFLLLLLPIVALTSCSDREITYSDTLTLGPSNFDEMIHSLSDFDFNEAKSAIENRLRLIGIDEFIVEITGEDAKRKLVIHTNGELEDKQINRLLSSSGKIGFYGTYDVVEIVTAMKGNPMDTYVEKKWMEDYSPEEDDTTTFFSHRADAYQDYFPAQLNMKQDYSVHQSVFMYAAGADTSKINTAFRDPILKEALSDLFDLDLIWSMKSEKTNGGPADMYALHGIKVPFDEEDLITNANIEKLAIEKDARTGELVLMVYFDIEGKEKFEELTSKNLNKQIAIVLNEQVVSAPLVRSVITEGVVQISGNFSEEEILELKALLAFPPLPFELNIVPN